MGKAADNEKIKLRATYLNSLAVGLVIASVLIPYLALIPHANEFGQWLDSLRAGTATVSEAELYKILATIIALLGAKYYRVLANKEISKIQD
jgi:hypothetical protein